MNASSTPEISLSDHGFEPVTHFVDANNCRHLRDSLGVVQGAGNRGVLRLPEVAAFVDSTAVRERIAHHLGPGAFPVRALYFDKSDAHNWLVPWHQDLSIAVRSRAEVPGFTGWSRKDGVWHVQPPVAVMERMVTLRLHLDAADASNGALRVLAGTHRMGRLTADQIQHCRTTHPEVLCAAAVGDILLMRPLLLHASGRSAAANHRRILHVEFAVGSLPGGLEWEGGRGGANTVDETHSPGNCGS